MKKLVLGFAATASLCAFARFAAEPECLHGGKVTDWWFGRFATLREEARKTGKDVKIAFVGDSITENWHVPGLKVPGDAAWERFFATPRHRAINLGFGGDRTEHVLWRLRNGQMDGLDPEVVVLQIGTNNLGENGDAEPAGDTIYGIRACVRTILAKCPRAKVVLHPIPPRGERPGTAVRRQLDVVNLELPRMADGRRVFWCDYSKRLLTADGVLTKEIAADGVHLTAKGHQIWAEALLPLIDALLGHADGLPDGTVPNGAVDYRPDVPRMSGWIDYRIGPKRAEILSNPSRHYDLVLAGDSITHFWEERGTVALAEILGGYKVLNLGFSGDRVGEITWDAMHGGLFSDYSADVIALLIGTNDLNDPKRQPADVAKGVELCIKAIREKQRHAKILLTPLFPRGFQPDSEIRRRVDEVNALLRPLADGKSVVWFDLGPRLVEKDGRLNDKLFPDGLHPSDDGYNIWAHELLPHLRRF
ncbi:MAG: GDSL-type esterase/lipase family protein [Kiritimatiellae bacterium]|nr:GDSL-type esterase/lipase family protein [Kiritimatiellia bacterium]